MRRKTLNPDESPEAAYGLQLRRSREAKGYTQIALAPKVPCHATYLSKIETATAPPTEEISRRLDELLETGGTLELMWRQIKYSALIEGFPEYATLEAKATLLRLFEVGVIPGLLQTEEYAAAFEAVAVHVGRATQAQADERVAFCLARQSLLEGESAPVVHAVLDESCLHRNIGGLGTMARQLQHLESMAQRPSVVLQVVPFSQTEPIPFFRHVILLTLADRATVGYTESMQRGLLERDLETVTAWSRDYDRLQAGALSPTDSLELIRALREEQSADDRRDRTGRRRVAQVQLQRPGRLLRRGR